MVTSRNALIAQCDTNDANVTKDVGVTFDHNNQVTTSDVRSGLQPGKMRVKSS